MSEGETKPEQVTFEDLERISVQELREMRPIGGFSGLVDKVIVKGDYELLVTSESGVKPRKALFNSEYLFTFTYRLYKNGDLIKENCHTPTARPPYFCFKKLLKNIYFQQSFS